MKKHARRSGKPSIRGTARVGQNVTALQDLPADAPIDGTVGGIFFDDANTTQCSRCQADADSVDGDRYTAYVEIEIYPPEANMTENANVKVHFMRYGRERGLATSDPRDFQLSSHELEPLAVALSRAVANAKARGFLPATSDGTAA